MHKQIKMAQRAPPRQPRTGFGHKESMADLLKDLELLRVDTEDYEETKTNLAGARDSRIETLKKTNGTLEEVCFSYVHKTFTFYLKCFKNSFEPRFDTSGSWLVLSLIL